MANTDIVTREDKKMFIATHKQRLNNGWSINYAYSPSGEGYRIERVDDLEIFANDKEAVRYVAKKALEGDTTCQFALYFIAKYGTHDELEQTLLFISNKNIDGKHS